MASRLYSVLNSLKELIISHITDYDNPHQLTFAQLGCGTDYITSHISRKSNSWGYTVWNSGKVELICDSYTTISASGLSAWNYLYYKDLTFTTPSTCLLSYIDWVDVKIIGGNGNYWTDVGTVTYNSDGTATIKYSVISAANPSSAVSPLYLQFLVKGILKS